MERFEFMQRRPIEPALGYTIKNFTEEPKSEGNNPKKNDDPTKKKQRLK